MASRPTRSPRPPDPRRVLGVLADPGQRLRRMGRRQELPGESLVSRARQVEPGMGLDDIPPRCVSAAGMDAVRAPVRRVRARPARLSPDELAPPHVRRARALFSLARSPRASAAGLSAALDRDRVDAGDRLLRRPSLAGRSRGLGLMSGLPELRPVLYLRGPGLRANRQAG